MSSRYSLGRLRTALECKHLNRGPPRFARDAANNASSECPDCGALWLDVFAVELQRRWLREAQAQLRDARRAARRARRAASQKK